jgi:hypothetical protein
MTTLVDSERTCCVCGCTSTYQRIAGATTFESPDLDTRPATMIRSTLALWVQRCPKCGYCADEISVGPPVAARIIRSDEYQRQLHDPKYPALANSFLCWALMELSACGHVPLGVSGTDSTEEQPDLFPLAERARVARAAWAMIYAAWACDDSGAEVAAAQCRRNVAELLRDPRTDLFAFCPEPGMGEVILSDLLRRSQQFEQVEPVCGHALSNAPGSVVAQLLRFQVALACRRDVARHTFAELDEFTESQAPRE